MKKTILSFCHSVILSFVFIISANAADVSRASGGNTGLRGNQANANIYRLNRQNTYFMVAQPDVDSACRTRIFKCLSDYCGDVTVVPGQRGGRCTSASESELYNWTLLCLQQDTTALLPQYDVNYRTSANGMNSAARICPSYVQQELMSYLSMANMAEHLTLQRSDTCVNRRRELEAAMSCHEIALSNANQTSNKLISLLTEFCGAGVPGGSAEMVQKYASAGNTGANVWAWSEKIITLDFSQKGEGWQTAVDAVLAGYMNRMNLACGENQQITTPARNDTGNTHPTITAVAAALTGVAAFPTAGGAAATASGTAGNDPIIKLWMEVKSGWDIWDYAAANQVVSAGLTNSPFTSNPYLSSAQMSDMQNAYKLGTKVFVIRDTARCWTVPVAELTETESALVAQQLASCRGN